MKRAKTADRMVGVFPSPTSISVGGRVVQVTTANERRIYGEMVGRLTKVRLDADERLRKEEQERFDEVKALSDRLRAAEADRDESKRVLEAVQKDAQAQRVADRMDRMRTDDKNAKLLNCVRTQAALLAGGYL
jgi:hypothetical protein